MVITEDYFDNVFVKQLIIYHLCAGDKATALETHINNIHAEIDTKIFNYDYMIINRQVDRNECDTHNKKTIEIMQKMGVIAEDYTTLVNVIVIALGTPTLLRYFHMLNTITDPIYSFFRFRSANELDMKQMIAIDDKDSMVVCRTFSEGKNIVLKKELYFGGQEMKNCSIFGMTNSSLKKFIDELIDSVDIDKVTESCVVDKNLATK